MKPARPRSPGPATARDPEAGCPSRPPGHTTAPRSEARPAECAPRVERRAEVRPCDLGPPDDDLASVEAPQLLLCEPDPVRLAVNAHQHPLSCDARKLVEPAALRLDRQMSETDSAYKVEGVVGTEAAARPVHLEYAEGKVLAAPANQRGLKSDPWIRQEVPPPPITRPHHSRSRGSSPSTRAERHASESTCCAARPPARNQSACGTPATMLKSRGRQREPVVGRPAPPTHGPQRLVPAVGREQVRAGSAARADAVSQPGGIYSRGRWLSGRGLHSADGQGTRAVRLRASTRAATPANRLDRPGCGRGAPASRPVDQARGEALRTRPGCPHDGPDHLEGQDTPGRSLL